MARLKDEKRRTLSSRTWLERQLKDPYVARAKREGLRSRAAPVSPKHPGGFHDRVNFAHYPPNVIQLRGAESLGRGAGLCGRRD